MQTIIKCVTGVMSLFIFLTAYYSAFRGGLEPQLIAVSLLGFLAAMVFLTKPANRKSKNPRGNVMMGIDFTLAIIMVLMETYILFNYKDFVISGMIGQITQFEMFIGFAYIILILEATRRIGGLPIVILAIFAMIHTVYANYFPGFFNGAGSSWRSLMLYLFKGDGGLWSSAFNSYCKLILYFLIFAGVLETTGVSKIFIDLSIALTGRFRGGPAKCAVVGSALMGTVQGAAVSNVVTTGTFAIPLMKKSGYSSTFAGGVQAVAATGSMIMPPVMGSAAFIMASFMGVPYLDVCIAGALPAILYYLAIFLMVDFQAAKDNIVGMPKEKCPDAREVLNKGWYMLLPLFVIIVLLVAGFSATMSAVWATISLVLLSFVKKENRITSRQFLNAVEKSIQASLTIAMYCASAGLVGGAITQSGLAMRISNLVLQVAGNSLLPALLITAFVSILLGMGLTTPVVFITVSTLFVPSLVKLGIDPMAANMFALYYGVVSNVTPPVALASFAAAGISGADPMKTAVQGFFLGIVAFIVPFAFVYNPTLLFIGMPKDIIIAFISASIGCVALAGGVTGWLMAKLPFYLRIALIIAGFCMTWPGIMTDLIGLVILVLVVLYATYKAKRNSNIKEAH